MLQRFADAAAVAAEIERMPGTYNYTCTPHPFMIGQIIVTGEAVASAPPIVVDSPAPKTPSAPISPERGGH